MLRSLFKNYSEVLIIKILHWDEMFHPSFGYQINVLPKFQARQGHEVVIVTSEDIKNHPTFLGFGNKENIEQEDKLYSKKYGIKIIRLPIHRVVSGRVIYKKGYLERIKALKPDVIMCHTNDTLSAIRIARKHKSLNIPVVFDNHMLEMASRNPLSGLFRFYFRLFVAPIIKKNKWVVIRTQDDNYVNRCLGIPESQTPFISFGSDTTLFHPDRNVRNDFRKRHDLKQNDFVIVYTGKLDEAKGGMLLAQAFKEKFKTAKNIVLVVVGNTNGEYGQKVDQMFAKCKNRVLRFPTQKYVDLAKFYQAADLLVFPKQCSLSFYDAQACGLPVISEDNNINIARLQHDNGFNFKADDIDDFRNKIISSIEMDELDFKQVGKNAYEFVNSNYNYKDIAQQYTDILIKEVKKFKERQHQ
jgi:glycosyltransferase involved in cell wall biosynthesis